MNRVAGHFSRGSDQSRSGTFADHGDEPRSDRSPLRSAGQRRTRTRDRLLDLFTGAESDVHAVDAAWTPEAAGVAPERTRTSAKQANTESPLTDSNRRPPLYEEGPCVNWVGLCIASQGGRCGWAR